MAEIILVIVVAVFICLLMAAQTYVDLVEYAYPALSKWRLKKRLLPFARYFALKLLVYTLAFHSSLLFFYQPSMKLILLTECVVVLTAKYIFALAIRSAHKYELIALEIPSLLASFLPILWYCWDHWDWIGD